MVDHKLYEALIIYSFPRISLWCYAFLSVLLFLGFQSLLGLVYGPSASQAARRLSHGSVFNFQIPAVEVGSRGDFGDKDTHKPRCWSLSGAQMGRRPSLQSQRGHSSHPVTPNCARSSKGSNVDERLGVGLGTGGGSSRVHSQDPVSSEGATLPPLMEGLGKGDLVRKNVIFSIYALCCGLSVSGGVGVFLLF